MAGRGALPALRPRVPGGWMPPHQNRSLQGRGDRPPPPTLGYQMCTGTAVNRRFYNLICFQIQVLSPSSATSPSSHISHAKYVQTQTFNPERI